MKKLLVMIISLCLLTSCANTDTVATVGKTKITKGEFEFYLSSIKNQLSGTELQTDEDWQTQEIEGEKAIEVAKRRALEIAVNNAEYIEVAKAEGMSLNDTEKQRIKDTKQQVITGYGGEKAYKEFLKKNNITDSFIQLMCESTVYYEKIADKVREENPITEPEMREYFETEKGVFDSEYKKAKHILILTQDTQTGKSLSEEEIKEAEELSNSLLERINAGEDFDGLMREYSQDPGLTTNPGGYVFTEGEMVSEFEQAVDSISFGEVTICKSSYGYHIIKRLPIEYEDVKDKIEDAILKERVSAKVKECNITETTNDKLIKSIK
ncbi:MAG: peptidylprolyl isomerase [Clostridia bacterium]|nr:peptidylprolyl isomerase [Clostridia bacterium]